MEQEVRKAKKTKTEPKLAFDAGKVFGLGELPEPQGQDLEKLAEEAKLNEQARGYLAKHGQGGDRRTPDPHHYHDRDYRARRGVPRE